MRASAKQSRNRSIPERCVRRAVKFLPRNIARTKRRKIFVIGLSRTGTPEHRSGAGRSRLLHPLLSRSPGATAGRCPLPGYGASLDLRGPLGHAHFTLLPRTRHGVPGIRVHPNRAGKGGLAMFLCHLSPKARFPAPGSAGAGHEKIDSGRLPRTYRRAMLCLDGCIVVYRGGVRDHVSRSHGACMFPW
jgi:hypothetical protein